MIFIPIMLLSAVAGALYARRRKGNRFDIAQYAAVWGVIGFLVGMVITIIVDHQI